MQSSAGGKFASGGRSELRVNEVKPKLELEHVEPVAEGAHEIQQMFQMGKRMQLVLQDC